MTPDMLMLFLSKYEMTTANENVIRISTNATEAE